MFEYRPVAAPYPGLRAFEPHESEIFFGREGHTDRLLEILQRERFLAVIGPSGCGKSSLVRAGLLPGLASGALGTGSGWRLALFRPGGQPLLALAQALLGPHALGRELVGENRLPKDAEEITAESALIAAELRRGAEGLGGLIRTATARQPEGMPPFNLLVLVDQFEELFTYAGTMGGTGDESEAFVDLLLAAREDSGSRVHVALTMRTDFLGHCVRFLPLPEAINRAQYLTPRLNPDELQRAIVGPARVFGGEVEERLAAGLIESIRRDSDQLPLLQHALARMWRVAERENPDSPRIDTETAEAVGGVTEALSRHAEEVLNSLSGGQQALAETLFRAITERRETGGQDVRRPQTLAAIAHWAEVPAEALIPVIRAFAAPEVSFLHPVRELTDRSVIDLTHEALIRQWSRLRNWVADEYQRGQGYRRWSQRAMEYLEGIGGLLTGGDLARALEWWNPERDRGVGPPFPPGQIDREWIWSRAARPEDSGQDGPETLGRGEGIKKGFDSTWQPCPRWAQRYCERQGEEPTQEFEHTRQFLIGSRDTEQQQRERELRRLEQQAEAERRRADQEQRLGEEARDNAARAEAAERQLTTNLFESHLTHASLLVRLEDYAEAQRVLAESVCLDRDIAAPRRHIRNLLAGYLEIVFGRAEQVYSGAGAPLVGGVAISPDGTLLAAAGERATLVLFDAVSGRLLRRLEGHDPNAGHRGAVNSVAFDPKGRWLLSAGEDRRIVRWSLPAGKKLGEWMAPERVFPLALSPDGATLAGGGSDGKITLWSTADGKILRTLRGHSRAIAVPGGLMFSPDGSRLASASFDSTARVWDWREGECVLILQGHTESLEAVVFSPDGKWLATAGNDKQVILWDAGTGQPLHLLRGQQNIVFGLNDKLIILWDAETGQPLHLLRGHRNIVFGLAYSADGRRLVSASRDKTLRLWDVDSGVALRIYQGHEAGLWSAAVRGDQIYTAADDATVRRWTLVTPDQWLWQTGSSPQAAVISPDGKMLALGTKDGRLRVHGVPEGRVLTERTDAHVDGGITRLALDTGGTWLATAGMDGTAKLWRLESEGQHLTPLRSLEGHENAVRAVAISPDGCRLATAGYDGRVGVFNAVDGQGDFFIAHEGNVTSIAFHPQGGRLLSAGEDRRLRLWDLSDTHSPLREIAQTPDIPLWASFSPDGREIAAVGRDSEVALYDLANPGAPRRLVGHEQAVYRAIYSPDGRQLATVSADMTVRFWDLDNLSLAFTLRLPGETQDPSPVWDFDFRCTPAGDCWIAVPLTVGRVAVYRLPYAHPPAAPAPPVKPVGP